MELEEWFVMELGPRVSRFPLVLWCFCLLDARAQVTTPFGVEVLTAPARCNAIAPATICFDFTHTAGPDGPGVSGISKVRFRINGPPESLGSMDLKVISPKVEFPESPWIVLNRSGSQMFEFPSPFGDLPVEAELALDEFQVQQFKAGRFIAYLLVKLDSGPSIKLPIQLTVGPDGDSVRLEPEVIAEPSVVSNPYTGQLHQKIVAKRFGTGPFIFLSPNTDTSNGENWLSFDMHWWAVGCAEYPAPCEVEAFIKPPTELGDHWGVWTLSGGGYGDRTVARIRIVPRLALNPVSIRPREVVASAEVGSTKLVKAVVRLSGGNYDGTPFAAVRAEPWSEVEDPRLTWPASLTIVLNPTGLAPGIYSDLVRVKAAGSDEVLASIPITFNIVAPTYGPYLSDGGGWRSSIYLVNPGRVPAKASLRFWTQGSNTEAAGSPWLLDLAGGRGLTSRIESETVPPLGLRVIDTKGTQSGTQHGWVELIADGPVTMYNVLTETRAAAANRPVEATIPVGNAIRDAALLPFDQLGDGAVTASFANPDDQAITVTVAVLNEEGVEIAKESPVTIGPKGAATFPIAARWSSTAKRRGLVSLGFESGRLLIAALRGSGAGFYSYAATPRGKLTTDRGIPHLVTGGPWQSTVHLTNSGAIPQSAPLRLRPDTTRGPDSGLNGELAQTVPANGVLVWQPTPKDSTRTEWGWLDSQFPLQVGGFQLLKQNIAPLPAGPPAAGGVRYETAIAGRALYAGRLAIPFDNRTGNATRIVLINPNDEPTDVQMVTYDFAARFPRFGETFRLAPRGELIADSTERWELGGQQGIIEFSSRQGLRLTGVGVRLSDGAPAVLPPFEK